MVLLRSLIDVFGHIRIDPGIPAVYVNFIIRCIIITRYFFQIYLGNFKFLISADLNTVGSSAVYRLICPEREGFPVK